MSHDKAIHPKDLPKPRQDADTRQPEEFIDKSSVRKDEEELPKDVKQQDQPAEPTPRNQ